MLRENSPMLSILSLAFLLLMAPAVQACFAKMTSCPHYPRLSQMMESLIPFPSPTNLDVECKILTDGLSCVSRTFSTPECRTRGMVNIYNASLRALSVPCRSARKEFLSGQACWNALSLSKKILTDCYMRNEASVSSNYCVGMLDFIRCINASILNVTGCGEREQKILASMATLVYNTNGQSLATPCPLQVVPSWQETTTTTTIITTTSPSPSTTATTAGASFIATTTTPADDRAKDSLEATAPSAAAPTTKRLLPSTKATEEGGGGQKRAQPKTAASIGNGGPVVRASVSLWPLAAWCLVCFFLSLRGGGVTG